MSDHPTSPSNSFLATLQELCSLLSRDPLTVSEVKDRLAVMSLTASVLPEPDSQVPAFVRVALPGGVRLTLKAIEAAFGTSQRIPTTYRGAPPQYVIQVDLPGAPYTCTLIISKQDGHRYVAAVTVRRDIRLE
jgi:hypothetical protein